MATSKQVKKLVKQLYDEIGNSDRLWNTDDSYEQTEIVQEMIMDITGFDYEDPRFLELVDKVCKHFNVGMYQDEDDSEYDD